MYVRSIYIKNICGIRELELPLINGTEAPGNTLIIGKNGSGKSSILRSLALGLASEAEATALLAEPFGSPFVSVGESNGIIRLKLFDEKSKRPSLTKTIEKNSYGAETVKGEPSNDALYQSPLVVALGAGRSNEGAELALKAYSLVDSTYTLFNYEGTFTQPELTLRRLRDYVGEKQYTRVVDRIKRTLGLGQSHVLRFERGGGVMVSGPDRETAIPLHSWADGYRITLNWILDIYAWAMKSEGSIDEQGHVSGFLLVDEIEQHLHPSMQRGIFGNLKELFPKLQVLASTHSPLVVQGVGSNEIVSLHLNEKEVTSELLDDYSGFSVEDILTAEKLFSTPPYSIEVENIREEYRGLVVKARLSSTERERLKNLGERLMALRILSPQYEEETIGQLANRLSELANDQDQQNQA